MPAEPPADPPGRSIARPRRRNRHGRHEPRTAAGPRHTLGPPKTIPYGADEYEQAVHAWAVLIAAWFTDHPPTADQTES